MPSDYPDAAPSQGWPASHSRRLDALERSLVPSIFAATLLGNALPQYVPREAIEHVQELAKQYPGPSSLLGLVLFLGVAKIPPPPEGSAWMPLWKFWAKYSPTVWNVWGGLKLPGRIEPELPPPTLRDGAPPPEDQDPRGGFPRDGGSP